MNQNETILTDITIKPQDMPEALKRQYENIKVCYADLPGDIYAVFCSFKKESLLGVLVSPRLIYDGIIAHLRLYANNDETVVDITDRMKSLDCGERVCIF